MRKTSSIIVFISCSISIVAVIFAMLIDKVGAVISSLITTAITLFGAVVIWVQLRKNKLKASGELVYKMNMILLKSPGLVHFRDKLMSTCDPKDYSVEGIKGKKDLTEDLDNFVYDDSVNIIEYLEFFENIGEMYFSGSVTIKDMDNCFGDMFFAAMNNPYVQNREIIPYKEHYQTSIKLYGDWSKYREKHAIVSLYSNTPLDYKNLEVK